MKEINTYLTFDGNCREAMTFYAKCFSAELHIMPFSEGPNEVPAEARDRTLHSKVTKGSKTLLMASDEMPGSTLQHGNNVSIAVECESPEEIDGLFAAFSEGATIRLPLSDVFWGARFGMLTDQFGIQWMFNFEKPKQS